MFFNNTDTFFIGSGLGLAILQPPSKKNPKKEYVLAGPMRLTAKIPFALPAYVDDVLKKFGAKVFDAMLTDPAVRSSYNGLKLSILDGGIHLLPTYRPPYYRRKSGEHQLNPDRIQEMTPQEKRAKEICEFSERVLSRVDDLHNILFQSLDCMGYGCKLQEPVLMPCKDGIDKGKLIFKKIAVKPDWAWRFVVDSFLNVHAILTWSPEKGGFLVLDSSEYTWMSWLPTNGDPRGTSVLRAAYEAWNLKVQIRPQFYQHMVRWGSPGIDMEMAEGDTQMRTPVDLSGNPIPGAVSLPPEVYQANQLAAYQNGSALVHPAGSKINVMEPKSPGEAFINAFNWLDSQIVLAIQHTTRAAVSGEGGNYGDGEIGEDNRGIVVSHGRRLAASLVRKWLRMVIAENYGEEDADLYTPIVQVGEIQIKNKAALWNAAANLARSGYVGESQKAELDAKLDLPPRDPEADAAADAAKAANAPTKPGQPGQPQQNKPDDGKGDPQPDPSPDPNDDPQESPDD